MLNRKDINIIKAVAVLAVIIYHLNPAWVKYGYLGVDIFFVVSGFLITGIYLNHRDNSRDVMVFLSRRVKRLFPAMLMLLSMVYLYAFIKLPPVSLKIVGYYVISALMFSSNIFDGTKGIDYFEASSGDNPLYHLWSLGVEFQFYIFISLFFLIIARLKLWTEKLNFLILLLGSLMMAFLVQDVSKSTKFYILPFRMWEFAMGGIIVFGIFKNFQYEIFLKLLGLTLIGISLFVESESINEFRNYICVVGTVLFLGCGVNIFESKNYNILNWIGVLSYSLYLWHVPVQFVLLREMNVGVAYYFLYFICLFFISIASYNFIELRFRYKSYSVFLKIYLMVISFLLIAVGVIGSLNGGYPERSKLFANLTQNIGFGLRCNGNTDVNAQCASSNKPSIAVVGNSYAMAFVKPLLDRGVDLVQLTQDSCAIGYVDNVKSAIRKSCNNFFSEVVQRVRESSFKSIIISSPFDKELSDEIYLSSFLKIISDLDAAKIVIIGPTPRAPFNVGDCLSRHGVDNIGRCDFYLTVDYIDKINKLRGLLGMHHNVEFFDISELICPHGYCRMTDGVDRPIYVDDGHLSLIGAKLVIEKINHKFFLGML